MRIASFLAATFLLTAVAATESRSISGKVVQVTDGDTLTVLFEKSQIKIRLEGIDAPESGQAFGDKSRQALQRLTIGKEVDVKVTGEDKYGRTLGFVFVEEVNVNEQLLKDGWAWHYKKYNSDAKLAQLENSAKLAKAGIWSEPNQLPPWEFRQRKSAESSPSTSASTAEKRYWLNTKSNVRHNSSCEHFGNTKSGRPCGPDEGKPCGKCKG